MHFSCWFKISVIHFHDSPVGSISDTVEGIYIEINEVDKFRIFFGFVFRTVYLLILRWCSSKNLQIYEFSNIEEDIV